MVVELYWSPIAAQWHGKGKPVTEDTMCNHNLSFKEMNICTKIKKKNLVESLDIFVGHKTEPWNV